MKITTLRFNYEFSRVYKRGHYASGRFLTVHVFKRYKGLKHNNTVIPMDFNRIGFCANKKQLGAVDRNRAKRLLRESYRQYAEELPKGNDIVFSLKTTDSMPSFAEISGEMKYLLTKLKLLNQEAQNEESAD